MIVDESFEMSIAIIKSVSECLSMKESRPNLPPEIGCLGNVP